MKTPSILMTFAVVTAGIIMPGTSRAQTSKAVGPAGEIAKIEAQEFSRSLAQLKMQEVTLRQATPLDEKALGLNQAQQNALRAELNNLSIAPLKEELQHLEAMKADLASDLRPQHPKMLALEVQIAQTKEALAANH